MKRRGRYFGYPGARETESKALASAASARARMCAAFRRHPSAIAACEREDRRSRSRVL